MAQKRPRMVRLAIAGLLIGVIAVPASGARADMIIFDDLTETPMFRHIGSDTTVTGSCSVVDSMEACEITLTRPGQTFVSSNIPPDGLNFAEDPQLQFFSDQVSATRSNDLKVVTVSFLSFDGSSCSGFEGGCQLQENGQQQMVGSIEWSGGGPRDDIFFQSDIEAVPEPASWAFLATGLLGLLVFGSRSRGLAA